MNPEEARRENQLLVVIRPLPCITLNDCVDSVKTSDSQCESREIVEVLDGIFCVWDFPGNFLLRVRLTSDVWVEGSLGIGL